MSQNIYYEVAWREEIVRDVSKRQSKINRRKDKVSFTEITLWQNPGNQSDMWFRLSWHAEEVEISLQETRELLVRPRSLLSALRQLKGMSARVKSNIVQHGELVISDDYGRATTRNHMRGVPDQFDIWDLAHFPVTRYDFRQHLELFERAREEYDKISLEKRQKPSSV